MEESLFDYVYSFKLDLMRTTFKFGTDLLHWEIKYKVDEINTIKNIAIWCKTPTNRKKWKLKAEIKLAILEDPETHVFVTHTFKENEKSLELKVDYDYPETFSRIYINILESSGLWPLIQDYISFTEMNKSANAILVVNGKKRFYVNLDYLATYSPYFTLIKKSHFGLLEWPEIFLGDAPDYIIPLLLRLVYFDATSDLERINEANIEDLLSLASRLKLETVLIKCERAILNIVKKKASEDLVGLYVDRLLYLANEFDLNALLETCHRRLLTRSKRRVRAKAIDVPESFDMSLREEINLKYVRKQDSFVIKAVEKRNRTILPWIIDWRQIGDKMEIAIKPECYTKPNNSQTFGTISDGLVLVSNWSITANVKVSLDNEKKEEVTLNFNARNLTAVYSFSLNQSLPKKLTIEAKVTEIRGLRFYLLPTVDLTRRRSISDLKLDLNGSYLYVNLKHLACHSEYFKMQLEREDELETDEDGLKVLVLEEVDFQSMVDLISVVYMVKGVITDTNMEALLSLSHRFLFTKVLIQSASLLKNHLNMNNTNNLYYVQLAFDYQLEPLVEYWLNFFTHRLELERAIRNDKFKFNSSKELQNYIFRRLNELPL